MKTKEYDLGQLYLPVTPAFWFALLRYPLMVIAALAVGWVKGDFNTIAALVLAGFCIVDAFVIGSIDPVYERARGREKLMLRAGEICILFAFASALMSLLHGLVGSI